MKKEQELMRALMRAAAAARRGRPGGGCRGTGGYGHLLDLLNQNGPMSQQQLAETVGVSRQTISSLENGRYNPSIHLAFKLARYFGLTVEEIPLHRSQILRPELFNVDQSPLSAAEGKMLKPRELEPFVLPVLHQIMWVQVTPAWRQVLPPHALAAGRCS